MMKLMRKIKPKEPGFLGIGVMKGGSSWTWRQLKRHPQIGVPKKKEIHFFDWLDISLKQYMKKFGKLKMYRCGEYTPNYICCPYAPELVKTYFPNTKLFTIFRNPVDRAFSHYKDHMCRGKVPEGMPFLEAFYDHHPQSESIHYSIQSKGMYGDQLEKWQRYFNSDQLKVFYYDNLVENPLKFLKELYNWLEVDDTFVPDGYDEKVLKKYNRIFDHLNLSSNDREEVRGFYDGQIVKLEELTGHKLNWS